MELSLKKITLALVALGLSGAAFAGSYTPEAAPVGCTAGNVTVPCEKSAWDIGFTGMYVQATNDDLHDYSTTTVAGNNFDTDVHTLNPKSGFAFNLQGSYHWGTGSDITVDWTHLNRSSSTDVVGGTFGPVNNPVGRFIGGYNTVSSTVKFQHDAVNVAFGQLLNVGEHVDVRLHGGLQWARVDGTFDQSGVNVTNGVVLPLFASEVAQNTSKFDGIGPRAGFDASYKFGNGLSLVGRSAIALLVGDIKTDTYNAVAINGLGTFVGTSHQTTRTVVPAANADLGVAYTHAMAQGDLGLEAGYRVAADFNSVRWVDSANTNAGRTGHEVSNFGYHGFYLTAKWTGNMA